VSVARVETGLWRDAVVARLELAPPAVALLEAP